MSESPAIHFSTFYTTLEHKPRCGAKKGWQITNKKKVTCKRCLNLMRKCEVAKP